jgi:hypothetical protein
MSNIAVSSTNDPWCVNYPEKWPWPVPTTVPLDTIPDPAKLTNIQQINTAISNLMAAIIAYTANPKPTYILDGQEFDWGEFMKMLTDGLKALITIRQMFGTVKVGWLGCPCKSQFNTTNGVTNGS